MHPDTRLPTQRATSQSSATSDERTAVPLPQPDDAAVRAAVAKLVHQKFELDRFAESPAFPIQAKLHGGAYGPLCPTDFYRKIFPFVTRWEQVGEDFPALVPTDAVLGCSWRWRGNGLDGDERRALADTLLDPINALDHHYDRAHYFWVRALGLVIPHEGKNRVDFLREQGAAAIPARVVELVYPDIERMVIYSVNAGGRDEVWAVLDARWVERLAYPDWSVPVLKACGVRVSGKWECARCSVADVAGGFATAGRHASGLAEHVVDMAHLAERRERLEQMAPCSALALEVLRLRLEFVVPYFALFLACTWALVALPSEWRLLREAAALAFGACVAVGPVLGWRIFKAPAKLLKAAQG